ncbi:MAG: transferrin receptor-like dimerization domain-containing protein, partial [Lewinella sp.]
AFNMGFGGESSGGEYHTMYDSYAHYKRFKDPDFSYGGALVKVAGRTTLRLANADVLPFEFTRMAATLQEYGQEVMKLAEDTRKQTERQNRLIRENAYTLAADPTEEFSAPEAKEEVPYLNFAPLQNGLGRISELADDYSTTSAVKLSEGEQREINRLFMDLERQLTREEGLPRRPWFVHHVYAPGFYTGYGVKTLPGVREAIEQRNFDEAQKQIDKLGEVLNAYAGQMQDIIGIVATK